MQNILIYIILIFCFSFNIQAQITGFQRTYGLPGFNYGVTAFQTSDKGYMILGNKSGFTGNSDIYIIKTDNKGKLEWDKAIGDSVLMFASDFKQTADAGMIISGYTNSTSTQSYNFLVIKTDSLANIEWQTVFGGDDWDFANSIAVFPNIGYFIGGTTYNNTMGKSDGFLAGINMNGDTMWTKNIGGIGDDFIMSIDTTNDGNLIAAGYTNSFGNGGYDFYFIKLNTSGDILWEKTYGQAGDEKAYKARATIDGGYAIIGSSNSPPAQNLDPWLIKTNANGDSLWNYFYFNSKDEEFYDIKQDKSGNYLLAGYTTTWGFGNKEVIVHLVSPGGDYLYGNTYGEVWDDVAYSANFDIDGGFFFVGTTESKGVGISNIYFIKTNEQCYTDTSSLHIMNVEHNNFNNSIFKIFPNPATDEINISLIAQPNEKLEINIYNIYGNLFLNDCVAVENENTNLKYLLYSFPQGIYYIELRQKSYCKTIKFIKS